MCHNNLVTLLVISTVLIGCQAQEENRNVEKHPSFAANSSTQSLKCFECNSQYDPACDDPFNNYSIGVIDCSLKLIPEHLLSASGEKQTIRPTVCRKIVQKIDIGKGTTKRIIRECGYIQDELDDKRCLRRTGTMGVETHYCACSTSLCNAGISVSPFKLCLVFALVAVLSDFFV